MGRKWHKTMKEEGAKGRKGEEGPGKERDETRGGGKEEE